MRFLLVFFALALATTAHAQGLRRTTVWIQNPTSNVLYFSHKAGGDDWRKTTLRSGYTQTFTGIDPHWVSFNNGKRKTIQYRLIGGTTNYFRWKNGALDLIKK